MTNFTNYSQNVSLKTKNTQVCANVFSLYFQKTLKFSKASENENITEKELKLLTHIKAMLPLSNAC